MYEYRGRIIRVVDGDTVVAELDLGLHCYHVESLRLSGIDAPELFSGDNREAGQAAKEALQAIIDESQQPHDEWPLIVWTFKDRQTFGRYEATIANSNGEHLAVLMVESGHAKYSKR